MRVEILGSAGAIPTPRATCDCRVCAEARARGGPDARTGPSTFVHGPDVLLDTPEEKHLEFMAARGWVEVVELADGDVVELDGVGIRPFRLAED
jgi:hypothetical protein